MMADFADPRWAYVWPAYGAMAACFIGLAAFTIARLIRWSRAARAEDT